MAIHKTPKLYTNSERCDEMKVSLPIVCQSL